MKYAKPEVRLLGDATGVIQGVVKVFNGTIDFRRPPPRPMNYIPSYELDE